MQPESGVTFKKDRALLYGAYSATNILKYTEEILHHLLAVTTTLLPWLHLHFIITLSSTVGVRCMVHT